MASPFAAPILVGYDFSEGAEEALRQANDWALRTQRPLVVAHAHADPVELGLLFPHDQAQAHLGAAAAHERLVESVTARARELTGRADEIDCVVAWGSGHAVLLAEAERLHPAVVVVGATGRRRLGRLTYGTTADHVSRHAASPVLVARPATPGAVVVASDLSEPALDALRLAADEARRRGSPLVAVHALTFDTAPPDAPDGVVPTWSFAQKAMFRARAAELLEKQLAACGASAAALVIEGRPAGVLLRAVREHAAELLVVGSRGRGRAAQVALGSVAARVARKAPCSVLIVRTP
jgi:nucleotide-binding universal stress UspA family protein